MQRALGFTLLMLLSGTLTAREFCVRTVAEFNTAWRAADREEVVIKLAAGNYNFNNSCIDGDSYCEVSDNPISIRGGYNSTCTSRSDDPAKTVITHPTGKLWFGSSDDPLYADLVIERLTIQDADRVDIEIETVFSGNYGLLLERVHFDRVGLTWVSNIDQVLIDQVVVTRGEIFSVWDADDLTVRQSTFAGNLEGLSIGYSGHAKLIGNILFGNTTDLDIWNADLTAINNRFVTIDWNQVNVLANEGQSIGDPRFIDLASGNVRLASNSSAINASLNQIGLQNQSDHDGGPRWYGDKPDLGAFETNIGSTQSTLKVTNTSDAGPGSLRQALIDANASDNQNDIEFAIGSSCGPRTISPQSLLPKITGPVRLRGFTQPGAQRNTLAQGDNATRCIVLNGGGSLAYGLAAATAADAAVGVDGLAFGGFALVALNLSGGNGHEVTGSQFGPIDRLTLRPNLVGVQVGSLFGSGEGFRVAVGGSANGDRNLFSNHVDAIRVSEGAIQTHIENNYIGLGTGAETGRGNQLGVLVQGLTTVIQNNLISASSTHGVRFAGTRAKFGMVRDNRFGLSAPCGFDCNLGYLGNGRSGVRFDSGAVAHTVRDNDIRFNQRDGISITDAEGVNVHTNRITDNIGQPIDLGDDGTNAQTNNSFPAPAGSGNKSINRPLPVSSGGTAASGTLIFTLKTAPGDYRINAYGGTTCELLIGPVAGQGHPVDALGQVDKTVAGPPGSDVTVTIEMPISKTGNSNYFNANTRVMLTATRLGEYLGTSEMSPCVSYALQ